MNNRTIFVLLLIVFAPFLPRTVAQTGGPYAITQSVVAGGGSVISGGVYSLSGTAGQPTGGPLAPSGSYTHYGGFWTPPDLAPTAAMVSVSGRVTTADGSGIRNARLSLVDSSGAVRVVLTGQFGHFRFDDVPAGAIYTLTIVSRRFTFAGPVRVINVVDEIADIEFVSETRSLR